MGKASAVCGSHCEGLRTCYSGAGFACWVWTRAAPYGLCFGVLFLEVEVVVGFSRARIVLLGRGRPNWGRHCRFLRCVECNCKGHAYKYPK